MPSIDEVANQIASAGAPALFLDTCILLDIIRSTSRCLPNYAERALELLGLLSTSPPRCLVVISSLVPHEWISNAQEVTDEVIRQLIQMEEQSSHFHDACQALGIASGFGWASYARMGLAERLRDLSKQLVDEAICIAPDDGSRIRAFARVVSKVPPSQKSREVKDSAIIEEYLAICRGLQLAGFTRKRVFCTSNTSDYCEAGKGLHPLLASEFAVCGLTFTTNLSWAVHEVTH